jgi:hypothetical protein
VHGAVGSGRPRFDAGRADGVTSESAREIRELKRKNAELERTIEILKAATSAALTEHGCQIAPRTYYAWVELAIAQPLHYAPGRAIPAKQGDSPRPA